MPQLAARRLLKEEGTLSLVHLPERRRDIARAAGGAGFHLLREREVSNRSGEPAILLLQEYGSREAGGAEARIIADSLILEGPDGTRVTLNYYDPADEFFEGENYTATIFDDEAETPINSGEPPFTGRFKPRPPAQLSVFNGLDPQGEWRLQIYDAWHANTGTLEELKLIFNIPEPATFLLLLTALPFARSGKHNHRPPEK